MPSEEEREEEESCRVRGFGREFVMQGLSRFLEVTTSPQRREDTALVEADDDSDDYAKSR